MNRQLENCSKSSNVLKNPCLLSAMEKLYENRNKTGDIRFVVDGEEIRAHRCVLAALSPRYETQFYGAKELEDTITVDNVSPAAFQEFLQFFYTDDVTLTLNNIEDVLNLAQQSLVDELVTECTNFLMEVIGMDKLLWCYRLARFYDMQTLEAFCAKHIGVNIQNLFETAEFMSCDRDMLCHILDLNSLNCKEAGLFNACIAWAQAKCQRDGIDATDAANLRAALGEAFFKIRFCSMSNEEFAIISQQHADLLSSHELIEVFQAIALKGNGVRFSTFNENNCMPRESILRNLECAFTNGPRIPFNSTSMMCYIKFSTDKAIMLNGLVLCNQINGDFGVAIESHGKEDYPEYIKTTSENETRIFFDQPIQIEANECFLIVLGSKAFKQPCSGLHGFELEKQTMQNGVSFAIEDCSSPNLIERLLFNIDRKS